VQVLPRVHVLEPNEGAALESLPRLADWDVFGVGFFDGPEGVIVVVLVEAGDGLLAGAGAVGELGRVEVETRFGVLEADGRGTG